MSTKRALVVVTSVSKYPDMNRPTGLWFGEAVHFVDVLKKNGYKVDYVSPEGGYTAIDPESLKEDMMTDLDWKYYQDRDFMTRLGHTLTPDAVKAENYDIIYYAGGHGTIWDFKDNEDLQRLTREIYENNGTVSSVCHGAIGLLNVKDSEGRNIIDGKTVTGFSNSEEQAVGLADKVPYLTEDELKNRGAKYEHGDDWSEFAVADGQIITGQNPQSGKAVAEKFLETQK
ncbi:ThiJ/PfpI family protein [Staphylococcus petrasii]|uniref:ThiJ/PfpI family protein n=1 Tax=Staphylococcus petrasii TaxID=1276936 RepID=A0A380FVZ3_9STAP|nr:type 1 glutamine amidotransferase domain-containing protein [Staphylococcus petrasii]PNZ30545.1 type 1 glutamine amidotransferase domain-containing protein [Staphylococcus petrasii]PNZ84823.1 type 1 glutamine amidotransferase domain-containing protein [Staphylococcus petrasii]TGA81349.1 type 1 glutamine amidotransferase domain-containing protein [Staphylococcus petrasii]TGE12190.1 type 1 glutamine amidotransferase domain-containing protein [Staphylococcus petrasii]TGE17090.1 type 1 glutamin